MPPASSRTPPDRNVSDEAPRSRPLPAMQGVRDRRVLRAFASVPREAFGVGPGSNTAPLLLGRMLQCLDLEGDERVLELGTGSGYRAALLSQLAREVISVELRAEAAETARRRLRELGIGNVTVICGDGSAGWAELAPYQAIFVGVAAPDVPSQLLGQLADHGVLAIPIGGQQGQLVEIFQRRGQNVDSRTIASCSLPPLVSEKPRLSRVPWSTSATSS